jgi:hypothetical protein
LSKTKMKWAPGKIGAAGPESVSMTMDNELWVDLHTLISCSYYDNGFLHINFQYNKQDPEPMSDTMTYCLRKAIRAVGFKITKIECIYNDEHKCDCKTYYTNIPEALWESTTKAYNAWTDVYDERYRVPICPARRCQSQTPHDPC